MKTKEIQARLDRGYTMAIYGTRENIHEQMTNDIKELLEAINYTRCCKSDSEQLVCDHIWMQDPFRENRQYCGKCLKDRII